VLDPEFIAREIYSFAQETINRSNRNEYLEYPEKYLSIRQIDVFKLNHWDNPAKRSSLKWIQYSMDWDNMQEMPIHHSTFITTQQQINEIVSYCLNDVSSTKNIMNLSKDLINLRVTLSKKYELPLYSASEPKIAKEFFLHFLSKKIGIKKYDLRQLRTHRTIIDVGSIILPYIQFKLPEFNSVLQKFKTLKLDAQNTKGGFKYTAKHKGVNTDFGLGGIHGATEAGVYVAKKGMINPVMISTTTRHPQYPTVPTYVELGFKGTPGTMWYGMAAFNKTNPDHVNKFTQAVVTAIQTNKNIKLMENSGIVFDPIVGNAAQSYFLKDTAKYNTTQNK
jgi:hypothetical protein